jgi:glycosyltransferase involved in cell wall biosynthesis
MRDDELPLITIAVPSFNEEHHIEVCLRDLLAQDYPREKIEILVADGRSTDRTREIIARIAAEDSRVTLVDNPEKLQSAGLNEIIRRARGAIIVRADVHAEYAKDFVRSCVEVLEETGADNAGGAARAKAKTFFQRALCAALASPLGVGGSSYRDPDKEGFVDTVFPGAFRRRVFERVGLFDPRAITNEDAELNQRIVESGGKVYLSRKIVVHYYPRDSIMKLASQYHRYGQGRARTLLKKGKFLTLRPAVPFLLVSSAALLWTTAPPLGLLATTAYAAMTFVEAVRVGRVAGASAIPVVWAIFPVLHVAHGTGFARGLLRYGRAPDWTDDERLPPRESDDAAAATA